ncbi:hypothetical protein MPH_03248 [Macrophomina phaseolina MS6]|uniref:Uncharacterized protein n=1 Tax=Macrophomina phaseolina (strain MS6) TaxID=1126212 RepID=K2SRR7_MACPH|nr:hypothetical protein MPH_03248 [Macrophomina phaseolina MS6]
MKHGPNLDAPGLSGGEAEVQALEAHLVRDPVEKVGWLRGAAVATGGGGGGHCGCCQERDLELHNCATGSRGQDGCKMSGLVAGGTFKVFIFIAVSLPSHDRRPVEVSISLNLLAREWSGVSQASFRFLFGMSLLVRAYGVPRYQDG